MLHTQGGICMRYHAPFKVSSCAATAYLPMRISHGRNIIASCDIRSSYADLSQLTTIAVCDLCELLAAACDPS